MNEWIDESKKAKRREKEGGREREREGERGKKMGLELSC